MGGITASPDAKKAVAATVSRISGVEVADLTVGLAAPPRARCLLEPANEVPANEVTANATGKFPASQAQAAAARVRAAGQDGSLAKILQKNLVLRSEHASSVQV